MKTKLFLFLLSPSVAFCQQPPHQSQIGKILQNAGITDKYSSCPCDPYAAAVCLGAAACTYSGVPIPAALPASTCVITTTIICCGPATRGHVIRDYVHHTNFCGARICRTILNVFKPTDKLALMYCLPKNR